jgi:hypothetical protein
MSLQPFVEPWPLFSFLILYTVSTTPWTGFQPVVRPLPAHSATQTQNKRTHYRHPCLEWDSNPRSGTAGTPCAEKIKQVVCFIISCCWKPRAFGFSRESCQLLLSKSWFVGGVWGGDCTQSRNVTKKYIFTVKRLVDFVPIKERTFTHKQRERIGTFTASGLHINAIHLYLSVPLR